MKIQEAARLSGVSVRTLRYYDQIGLLPPSGATEAGYRLYDEEALATLQQILFFRELDFPLRQIREILQSPRYDRAEALARQRALLIKKRERLSRLIDLVDRTMKGEKEMSFQAFDDSEIEAAREKYAREARSRWGDPQAYEESERRAKHYDGAQWRAIQAEMEAVYGRFASALNEDPAGPAAQAAVSAWQALITRWFYPCTEEILQGLGAMYAGDERFRQSIDAHGEGLAQFMSRAIAARGKA